MICDAHHHLWSRDVNPYDVDDLRADLITEAIVGTADLRGGGLVTELLEVHVEAGLGKFRASAAGGVGCQPADPRLPT